MRRLRWMFLVRRLLVLLMGRWRRMRFFLLLFLVLPRRERGNREPHHQQHRAGDYEFLHWYVLLTQVAW
jgi:hypothetical protein